MMQLANVMFAIAACADVLEAVSLPVLPLNHLTKILCAVMDLAGLINASIGSWRTSAEAAESARDFRP